MSIIGPYQYKNRGQIFLLTGWVASQGSPWDGDGMHGGGAALKTPMGFNVPQMVLGGQQISCCWYSDHHVV